ncbi:Structural maintenance of chromosomes protein 4 [Nymphon striatum]|nr:Structural maintenance of chromosomes protein 4 [Nymphon striatum]
MRNPEDPETSAMEVDGSPELDEEDEQEKGIRIGDIYLPPPPPPACTFDSTGPRLIITHIDNFNFKSYAGKQVLGPFHKSFTSIVGPNGSGKSNVIDAMLFVFGYRAQKIRSKKISVLIHNSEGRQNIDHCSVSVHFQKIIDEPGDDYEVVPNSQFIVTRTAYRDNSSWYAINNKKLPFKKVATILRGHGIDLDHNRFLILQGEVEQISLMKPKGQTEHDSGMLEYLEDIIGSNRFKEPIELLSKRVEELNDFRGEKLNRVKAVEKEKDDLEGVKNEAIEYLTMENDIVKKKNELYWFYTRECQTELDKASNKQKEIEDGMSGLISALNELKAKREEKAQEYKTLLRKHDEMIKVKDAKKAEFTEYEKQDVRCREDLKHARAKVKKLEKNLQDEKKKFNDVKAAPEKYEAEIEEFKVKKSKHEEEKVFEEEELAKVMEGLKSETQGLQEEKDIHESELLELQKGVNDAKSKASLDITESELKLYLSNEQNEKNRLQELKKNYETVNSSLKERQKIYGLQEMIPKTEEELSATEQFFQSVLKEETAIAEELRRNRVKVEEAKSAMHSSANKGKVISALMEQKHSGKLPGVFGRLGDLGAIDDKYDIAISTACGALDHIVTDTVETAKMCVEFLKKNDVGVATFICLDKMEKWKEYTQKKIKTPENVLRLFDLVRVKEPKLLNAFYFALRNTLVANNLDQATRIAFTEHSRNRVVTLSGQLIDSAGTMSGGGNKVIKGRMGSSVNTCEFSKSDIDNMVAKLNELSGKSEQCREQKYSLEGKISSLNKELNTLKQTLKKFQMEIETLSQQDITLSEQLRDQEKKVKDSAPDKKKVKELESVVNKNRKEYDEVATVANEVEKKVQSLHNQIMEISGNKVKAAQQKLDSIINRMDAIDASITKSNVALKTAKRNIKKAQDKIASLEQESKTNDEDILTLDTEFKDIELKAKQLLDDFGQTQTALSELQDEIDQVKEAVNETEKRENKLNSDHIEVRHEVDKCINAVKDNKHKVKHWTNQTKKLTLHDIEGKKEELAELDEEKLTEIDKEGLEYEITVLEEKIQNMKPSMAAIQEYKKKEELYLQRVGELDKITEDRDQQRKYYDNLRKERLNEFMAGFAIITNKLKEMYQMITLGGDAELELVDSLDPFSEGIIFSVRPPKKSWKNISNLSGGEKTLSSLALGVCFTLLQAYSIERTKNAQFIIISLRNNMFELADRLVGIYKTYNATKSVTINPGKICLLKEENSVK